MSSHKTAFFNHIAQTSDAPIGLEIEYARGPFFYTTDGKRYTDFISGIAVSSLGHSHPEVVQAVQDQAAKHMHVMVYGEFIQKPQSELAQLLASQLPDNLQRIYFVNSGTEANEGALKLAKKATGRRKLVAFRDSYHGDTHGALSVTGRDVYRDPYLPLLPDVTFLSFNAYDELNLIDTQTACVIMEPIQGEGGIIPADADWLKAVRKRCSDVGALLIFDEIQSGMGRTGELFAFMHYNVVPDILCMAKALGGGMPIGAFASSDHIFEAFKYNPPLNHVTTFGGHPVSAAAAHASLSVILRDNLPERAKLIENEVREVLKSDHIAEIRGKGAMLGMQLKSYEQTERVVNVCMRKGVLLGWTLHSNTLIRLAPPLTIPMDVLTDTLHTIIQAVEENPPD
ncbi:MAG: aminotransferase class III-fold pyridoxal phosphate-dependent enzyme [Balneolales bacterium]|nr:aminotransferase class III-fold pyridoxal phosphate-dependent enzyme [Balneolales bacterium]